MTDWKECKLGDELELLYGKGLKETERIIGDFPVYGSNGIVGYHNNFLVKSPGIIIGRKGSVGEICFSSKNFYPIDTTYYVNLKNYNDINYFYYFLKTLNLNEMNSHSAVPGLNRNDVYSLDILLPPLPEQRAIAGVLSSLDDKIDLLHRQNKTLEAMAETLFRQWFVEEADEGWEEKKLSEVISVKHGFAFKGEEITDQITNNILVTPGNFKIGGGFKNDKFKYFIGDNFPQDYIFSPNDLVVTMTDLSVDTDTLGYPALIPDYKGINFLHNQRVGKIIFKTEEYNELKYFIYFLFKTDDYRSHIVGGASGTSIMHTSPDRITSYLIKLPDNLVINKFNNIVDPIFNKIELNIKQIRTLEKMRDTLLPKLMSGEVRCVDDSTGSPHRPVETRVEV